LEKIEKNDKKYLKITKILQKTNVQKKYQKKEKTNKK